jgi:predicted permease
MLRDFRYAARALRAAPSYTASAVAVLAIGIAATTAIFSLVNGVFLRPVGGVARPGALFHVQTLLREDGRVTPHPVLRARDVAALRDRRDLFVGVAGRGTRSVILGSGDDARAAIAELVSADYFALLGVRPALGRAFAPEEDVAGGPVAVAVLSHAVWADRFGADPAVVGRDVEVNAHRVRVVGVAPSAFRGQDVEGPALWMPTAALLLVQPGPAGASRGDERWLRAEVRLRDGVSAERANAALAGVAREWGEGDAGAARARIWSARLVPGGTLLPLDPEASPEVLAALGALFVLALLVLLVTAANAANLQLARAEGRRREIALRVTLGASRGRLLRQLLAESLLVAAGGGALALALGLAGAPALRAVGIPDAVRLTPDARVLAWTLGVALLTGVGFGLGPALRAARADLSHAVKDGGAGAGRARSRLRGGLVVAQVAVSLVLMVCAGLLLRTVDALRTRDVGLRTAGVLVASVDSDTRGYDAARTRGYHTRLLERAAALPSVESATLSSTIPFGVRVLGASVRLPGSPASAAPQSAAASHVGPDYFATLGIPLRDGRAIAAEDRAGGEPVAVVSETFARRFWPGERAVGRRVAVSLGRWDTGTVTVVGVAADVRDAEPADRPAPTVYLPLAQRHHAQVALYVRARGEPARLTPALTSAVRALLREVDPNLPPREVRALAEYRSEALLPARLLAVMLGAFGTLALAVAAVGLGGVVAFLTVRRTREIGVRLALGATPGGVVALVLRQGVRLAGLGLAAGLALAAAAGHLLRSQLHGVGALDPLAFGAAGAVLTAVALLASWLPARRAARVPPSTALRAD